MRKAVASALGHKETRALQHDERNTNRKTAPKRSLRNPVRCIDQAAAIAVRDETDKAISESKVNATPNNALCESLCDHATRAGGGRTGHAATAEIDIEVFGPTDQFLLSAYSMPPPPVQPVRVVPAWTAPAESWMCTSP
jgi:hypothetical protein